MKILVIEDSPKHQASARGTLKGHDLTIVDSYREGMGLLREEDTLGKAWDVMKERGLDESHPDFRRTLREVELKLQPPTPYDAVLTDMMLRVTQADRLMEHQLGKEVPYGFVLAIKAAQRGAKFVAMVTDLNHHVDAISQALDKISGYSNRPLVLACGTWGTKLAFTHAPFTPDGGKDWGAVLKSLTES